MVPTEQEKAAERAAIKARDALNRYVLTAIGGTSDAAVLRLARTLAGAIGASAAEEEGMVPPSRGKPLTPAAVAYDALVASLDKTGATFVVSWLDAVSVVEALSAAGFLVDGQLGVQVKHQAAEVNRLREQIFNCPDMVQDVLDFHLKFRPHHAMPLPGRPSEDANQLTRHLLEEEFEELRAAALRGDIAAVADGGADLIVVTIGLLLAWGIDLRPVWREVHRTNMAKVSDGTPWGKIRKPEGWQSPRLGQVLLDQAPLVTEEFHIDATLRALAAKNSTDGPTLARVADERYMETRRAEPARRIEQPRLDWPATPDDWPKDVHTESQLTQMVGVRSRCTSTNPQVDAEQLPPMCCMLRGGHKGPHWHRTSSVSPQETMWDHTGTLATAPACQVVYHVAPGHEGVPEGLMVIHCDLPDRHVGRHRHVAHTEGRVYYWGQGGDDTLGVEEQTPTPAPDAASSDRAINARMQSVARVRALGDMLGADADEDAYEPMADGELEQVPPADGQ